jgi:hypothetical protein
MGIIKYILDKYFTIVLVESLKCDLRLIYNINRLKCKYHHGYFELYIDNDDFKHNTVTIVDYCESFKLVTIGYKDFLKSTANFIKGMGYEI